MTRAAQHTPTFARYLRAPSKWWADDHPWCVAFGHGRAVPVCTCCGSGLTRHAIVDTDGDVWGMDCFATATGTPRRKPAKAPEQPRLLAITRRGYRVHASGQTVTLDRAQGLPAELRAQLSTGDRKRAERRMQRDGLLD